MNTSYTVTTKGSFFGKVTLIWQRLHWKKQVMRPTGSDYLQTNRENLIIQLIRFAGVEYWTNQERKETQLLSGPKASVVIGRVSSYCQGSKADRTLTNTDWVTTDQPQEAQHKKSWKPRR